MRRRFRARPGARRRSCRTRGPAFEAFLRSFLEPRGGAGGLRCAARGSRPRIRETSLWAASVVGAGLVDRLAYPVRSHGGDRSEPESMDSRLPGDRTCRPQALRAWP